LGQICEPRRTPRRQCRMLMRIIPPDRSKRATVSSGDL